MSRPVKPVFIELRHRVDVLFLNVLMLYWNFEKMKTPEKDAPSSKKRFTHFHRASEICRWLACYLSNVMMNLPSMISVVKRFNAKQPLQ